jgi:hypothetical protein
LKKKEEEAGPTELPSEKKRTLMSLKLPDTQEEEDEKTSLYILCPFFILFLLLILLACRTRRLSAITSHNPLAMVWK